jgi:signal transduction histidine kinase
MKVRMRMTEKTKGLQRRYDAAVQKLKLEILQRKAAEKKLEKSEKHSSQLLIESRSMQSHLRRLSHQIILSQENERKKISRELYDEVGQTLAGINLHLATLKIESRGSTKDLDEKITRTQTLVKKSVNSVHRFALELRPTLLDDLGLIPALQSYIKGFTKRTGIAAFPGVEQLNNAKRTVLYRVAQSALTNVSQHARASLVKLTIRKKQQAIQMQVKDNGISFQVERVLFAKKSKRLGLLGMRERVEMVGGRFRVESVKDIGTTISAQIPFNQPKGAAH